MSKFIENHPSAIEVFVWYGRERGKNDLYKKLCSIIGEKRISDEEFGELVEKIEHLENRDIGHLVVNNQANLRLCILSDVIDKKSIDESYNAICEMIGSIDYQDFEFWFNRFSSGNWNLYQKTFSDLPLLIVRNILEFTDILSQMRLRKVSRGLRNIVDQVKPSIDIFDYEFRHYDSQDIAIFRNFIETASNYPYEYFYSGEDYLERAFNDMKILLSNPRLRLAHFDWNNHVSSEIDRKLVDILNSLNHKIEIMNLNASLNGDLMIDLLKAMKPGALEDIDFHGDFEPIHIDRLAQLDQWKKATSVCFRESILDFSPCFHHFQHFERVDIHVESLSMDNILFVKKLFIQNNKLKYFNILAENQPLESEIAEALGLSDLHFNEEDECFSGRNEIPGSNEYLEVTFNDCRIKFVRKIEESD
uniref:F-box domain-containing protein n=1 Tax=Caenorhabditis tropicalis TaxID=1561998 RepID=A0A1I7UI85_9PELO